MADDKPRRRSLFHNLFTHKPSQIPSNELSSSSSDDADLTSNSKDSLFAYQLTQPDPRRLGPDAFKYAGIHDSSAVSGRIHGALCAASILSSHDSDYKVYTTRITRKLPSQVPWISVHAQRLLVGMLFFWEEELVRWHLIDTQADAERAGFEAVRERMRAEHGAGPTPTGPPSDSPPAFRSQPPTPAMFATDQSQGQGQSRAQAQPQASPRMDANAAIELEARLQDLWEQHRLALARLEASRKQLPSKRDEAGNRIGMSPGFTGRPPAYGDNLSTVGVFGSPSREASPRWGYGTSGSGEGGSSAGRDRRGTTGTLRGLGGLGEPALPIPDGEKRAAGS